MRSSVMRGIFSPLFKDFCVGINEIVVVVTGQPCVSRGLRERSGSGNGSGDRITWGVNGPWTMAAMASSYSSLSTMLGRGFFVANKTAGIHARPCSISLSPSVLPLRLPAHNVRPAYDRLLTDYGPPLTRCR